MGAAAKAARGKPSGQGKGFYQGNIEGFFDTNTAENRRWMRQNAKTGAFTWNNEINAYVRKDAPGVVSLWRDDGFRLKSDVKDQNLWNFADTRGKPGATPLTPPGTPSTPDQGAPGAPGDGFNVNLTGTGQQDQNYFDPYGTGGFGGTLPTRPQAIRPPAASPAPQLPTTGLQTPGSTPQILPGQTIEGASTYTSSAGVKAPKTGPAGMASPGGTAQGGVAAQPISEPQIATVGANAGATGRPSSAPIQNAAIAGAQRMSAAPRAPAVPGWDAAKARASYGAYPFAHDPQAPKPSLRQGKSYFNPFTGMWGTA